jgi:hypothetical protein
MTKDKFELSLLAEASPDVLAWLVPGARLFSWVCRSILVPAGWTALGTRQGRDPMLVRSGGRYEDEDTQDMLFIRGTPAQCTVEAADLRSADGFICSGTLELSIRMIEEPSELAAFRRTILGSSEVLRRSDLQRLLQSEMRGVLSDLAAKHSAEELLGRLDVRDTRQLVEARLGAICLAGGIAMDGPVTIVFDSPAYREHRRHQAVVESRSRHIATRVKIQEALAAAQKERLGHLTDMLQQLQKAADERKDLSVSDLLRTFSEGERAEMYGALWHLCPAARKAGQVAVVSGQEVLLFQPADLTHPARRLAMPETLGPLRSVSMDERSLDAGLMMVGARLGVHLVDLRTGGVLDSLSATQVDSDVEVRGGVNAAAMSDDHVYATHSECGLLRWPRRVFNPPAERWFPELTTGADTVRCARCVEGYLWFSADEKVWAWPLTGEAGCRPTMYAGSSARVSALAVAGGVVYAASVNGQILAWEVGQPDSARSVRGATGHPVESIDTLNAGAVDHLVVADRSTALQATVVEDNYVRRYEAGSMGVRRASVADDLFVAMNDNRDRLLAWDPRNPGEPAATVIVPHITGATIQDVCVIPQA